MRCTIPILAALAILAGLLPAPVAQAQRVSDVRGTRHNLSVNGPGTTRAAAGGTSEVCVFCHTPHGATQADQGAAAMRAPLWNRRVPAGSTYTPYTSSSMDSQTIVDGFNATPGGSSKLCLSCHDGTLAIGNVNVLNGNQNATIPMTGTGPGGTMPAGEGTASGFTRYLGTDLRNDHPISVTYTSALATRDGELRPVDAQQRWPAGSGSVLGLRSPGFKPLLPLEPTGNGNLGQVQCATCHDPHTRELDASKGNQKFLRAQRFQEAAPSANPSAANDIICLSCHDKNGNAGSWAYSAHARPDVATPTYLAAAAALREFPAGTPVWKASCLNCHDTHPVQGARRLTREGTDAPLPPGSPLAAKQGGNPALEKTCYQCHTTSANSVLSGATTVPNIESDFNLAIRMPITTAEQGGTTQEVHDISANFSDPNVDCTTSNNRCGADFMEPKSLLAQRHAECTDCHNPHRVVKFRSFAGGAGGIAAAPDAAGTHRHDEVTGYTHTNLASGVLRGAWGVEPQYGSASFQQLPIGYSVKRGDPGASVDTSVAASYVTREYQVCMKCHSDNGYADNNVYPLGNRPPLGRLGGTPSGTNNLTIYTNQAKEFQAPVTHRGELSTTDSGAAPAYATNNHRSWHPVMDITGRNPAVRGISVNSWRLPWRNAVGAQTMYCSDCHGSNVTSATSVIPNGGENGSPWGPHGSNNNFLLKGLWNTSTGSGQQATGLCFKCHDYANYGTSGGNGGSGFSSGGTNYHTLHVDRIGKIRCNWCHIAVPHGWKNKAFLVNLNDVGPEVGLPPGTQVRNNTTAPYNNGPYYMNAVLKIRTFRASGTWSQSSCGSAGAPGNGQSGQNWMADGSESCKNAP